LTENGNVIQKTKREKVESEGKVLKSNLIATGIVDTGREGVLRGLRLTRSSRPFRRWVKERREINEKLKAKPNCS